MRAKIFALPLAVFLLFAGAATASSKMSTSTHDCVDAPQASPSGETLEVTFQALRSTYRAGDTVKALVTVHRSAGTNKSREASRHPAAGVSVVIGLTVGDTFVSGGAVTGSDGKVVVSIPTWDDMQGGWGHAKAIAWKDHAEAICHTKVSEQGKRAQKRFIKIRS